MNRGEDQELQYLRASIEEKSRGYEANQNTQEQEDPKAKHLRLQRESQGVITTLPEPSKAQKLLNECIETEEPFFIFRAKDIFSVMILAQYAEIIEKYGPDDAEFHKDIIDELHLFKDWQRKNIAKVRYPD